MTRPVDWLYTASAIRISACRFGRLERASCKPKSVCRKSDSTVMSQARGKEVGDRRDLVEGRFDMPTRDH